MTKICTSLEQSQKLIELGVDINTADMRYGYIAPYDFSDRMYDGGYDEVPYPKDFLKKNPNFSENEYDGELPAWSLSALLELMPKELEDDFELYYGAFDDNGEYQPLWACSCMNHVNFGETSIDAAFKVVCWLLENKKL